jgi:endonuclease/exonuclease/phosphatase family metal-dependent hydrolase
VASHPGIVIRLLTWNLFHGRDAPPDATTRVQIRRSLRSEFVTKLDGWEWDVALLQESPPRWFDRLADGTGAVGARSLTSRNWLGPLRSAVAERKPDLIASNEGGSNVVLVRRPARILDVRSVTLARWPERRTLLMARLGLPGGELVVGCAHLSVPATGRGPAEVTAAAEALERWAAGAPVVLGGDLNLRPHRFPEAFDELRARFGLAAPTGPRSLDHLLAAGLDVVAPPTALPAAARDVPGPRGLAIRLSDHAPVIGAFRLR